MYADFVLLRGCASKWSHRSVSQNIEFPVKVSTGLHIGFNRRSYKGINRFFVFLICVGIAFGSAFYRGFYRGFVQGM